MGGLPQGAGKEPSRVQKWRAAAVRGHEIAEVMPNLLPM